MQRIAPFFVSGFRFGFPDITLQIILIISFCLIISLLADSVVFQLSGYVFFFIATIFSALHPCNTTVQKVYILPLSNTNCNG